jgi:hypothetical protein
MTVQPATMNFGSVAVGSSQKLHGNLAASGGPVVVSTASWNGSGYSLSGITFPVTVPDGQQVGFDVTFAPQVAGTSSGSITFLHDGATSSTAVQLSGTGAQSTQHSVMLNWSPSTSSVQGYYVYRGQVSGGPYTRISGLDPLLSYTDLGIVSGRTYFYVVTALGTDNLESSYSNQVVATIP